MLLSEQRKQNNELAKKFKNNSLNHWYFHVIL